MHSIQYLIWLVLLLGKDGLVIKKLSKKITRNLKRTPKQFGPSRKLCANDEMLLSLFNEIATRSYLARFGKSI